MRLLTPNQVVGPRIVTEAELKLSLTPLLIHDKWAQDTIGDLWRMGAPTPDSGPNTIERRILLPKQFQKWFDDVAQRHGFIFTAVGGLE